MEPEIHNQSIVKNIQNLTHKKNVILTNRCNDAIISSFSYYCGKNCAKKNRDKSLKLLIQDQGGWLLYPKLAKKFNLDLVKLQTIHGRINIGELKKYTNSILIINSMPGYSYDEDMNKITKVCKLNNIFLVNDCCGSIGSDNAKYGDIIVCSFRNDKPLCFGRGGFFATNIDEKDFNKVLNISKINISREKICFVNSAQENINIDEMNKSFNNLSQRIAKVKKISEKVKYELKEYDILNKGNQGINVLTKYRNDDEKERLINYCRRNNFEFTQCPRYIRTNEEALSIELKRLIKN